MDEIVCESTLREPRNIGSCQRLRMTILALATSAALLLGACGSAETEATTTAAQTDETGVGATTDPPTAPTATETPRSVTTETPTGSDDDDDDDDDDRSATTDPPSEEDQPEEPGAATSPTACSEPTRGAYIVTNIAVNDPDGGLVLREAPGRSSAEIGVAPPDFGLFVTGACAITDDGDTWWEVSEEGVPFWANANFIGKYTGIGNREPVGTTEAVCTNYNHLRDAQETDIPITVQLIALDVELGGQPVGVSGAISDLVNGIGTAESFSAIDSYVGPICESDAGRDGVDAIAGTSFETARELCNTGDAIYCGELLARADAANAEGGNERLRFCGRVLREIDQFTPASIDFEMMIRLQDDDTPDAIYDDLTSLVANPTDQLFLDSIRPFLFTDCGDFMFTD